MDAEKVNTYEACDKAIQVLNRENLRAFGRLKMAKWDEIKIIRTVSKVYADSVKRAKQKFYEVAFEAYVLGLIMCDVDPKKAHEMAEDAIDMDFVEEVLEQTDFVTLYRFNSETERKAAKLAETLEVATDRNAEIDRALKFWSQQLGQYCINFTDYATIQAFEDAGVEMVQWIAVRDKRLCRECYALDGQVFRIDEFPRKPHVNCRCRMRPIFRKEDD